MGLFDSLGIKTADEAAEKLSPLLDNLESRLRDVAREEIGRLNGATVEFEIVDSKLRMTVAIPPPTPPSVRTNQ